MSLGPVLDAALQVQSVCERHGLAFCVIGGVALQRWGEPRFTADVDLSLFTQAGEEEKLAATLIEEIEPRFEDALEFARRNRVLLLQSTQGVGIDVVLAGLPFEARVITRASRWKLDDANTLTTCGAEDLVVMKAFAARDRDWADVTSVLERQGRILDFDLIRAELRPLVAAKEEPGIVEQLEHRIQRIIGRDV